VFGLEQIIPHESSDGLLGMRLACLFIWGITALCLLPGLGRYFQRGDPRVCDEWRVALFFTAVVMMGNYIVRIFAPDAEPVLTALNATTAALAVYILILIAQGRLK
jgi:hypothetical protein